MNKETAYGYHWRSCMEGGRIIHTQYPYEWYSDDVISVNGDTLELVFRESKRDVVVDGIVYHPSIEKAIFRTEEAFDYGFFSADVQLPKGKNVTCAFWLSGQGNWPPEIDICEAWNKRNTYLRFFTWRATTNVHYRNELLEKTHVGNRNISWFDMCDPSKAFHNYACLWTEECITFYVDGKVVRVVDGYECKAMVKNVTNPEKGHKMNIILSCGVDKDPIYASTRIDTPMRVRNIKYEAL